MCLYICNLRWPGGCCWGSACWFICTCCLLPLSLGGLFVHLRHTRCMLQLLLRSSCFGFVCSCCMYDPIFVCVWSGHWPRTFKGERTRVGGGQHTGRVGESVCSFVFAAKTPSLARAGRGLRTFEGAGDIPSRLLARSLPCSRGSRVVQVLRLLGYQQAS